MPNLGQIDPRFRSGLFLVFLALAFAATAAIRYASVPLESADLVHFRTWYRFIADNGHFAALTHEWFDYNVPYLYLLAAVGAALPSLDPTIAVKAISVAFDYALAFAVYKCVGVKSRTRLVPLLAALATLMAPTVLTNSSLYGQTEAIYATFLVACLYFLLAGRQAWAFVAFGLALAFKLQAVFLAPLFLWLLMKRACDWRCFLLVPAVFLAALVPAWLVGRPLESLLSIYWRQAETPTWSLSAGLPNLWAWVPDSLYQWWPLGVVLAACTVLLVAVAVRRSPAKMTSELLVLLATYSALVVPFVLPKMHQRYFFPAEVIGIVLAFYLPRYWFVPVIVGGASFGTYLKQLIWFEPVDLKLLALVVLGVLAILTWQLLAMLAASRVLSVRQLLVSLAAWSLVVGLAWLAGGAGGTRADVQFPSPPAEMGRTAKERLLHYRDYAATAIQTALPRVWPLGTGTLQPHPRFQAAYERIVAGDLGEPLIRSVFDVYRDGKTLIYVKRPCSTDDIQIDFSMGVTSLNRGVVGWPFYFRQRGVVQGDLCIVSVPLPHFEFEHMGTSQNRQEGKWGWLPESAFWRGGRMMSMWERPATFEANPRYQAIYEQSVAGDFGEPVVRSLFDVYRDGKTVIYIKRSCSMDDIQTPFFLDATHGDGATTSGRFLFLHYGVMDGNICIATVQMAQHPIGTYTGQWHLGDPSCVWCEGSTL